MADEDDIVVEDTFETNPDAFTDKNNRPDWWPEDFGEWSEKLGRWVDAPEPDEEASAAWEAKVADEGTSEDDEDAATAWTAKVAEEGEFDESQPVAEWEDVVEEFFQPELGADGEPVHDDPDPDSIEDDSERANTLEAEDEPDDKV